VVQCTGAYSTVAIPLYTFSAQKHLWVHTNQYEAANRGENKSARSICTAGSFIKEKNRTYFYGPENGLADKT
jgi:hypothetical protein